MAQRQHSAKNFLAVVTDPGLSSVQNRGIKSDLHKRLIIVSSSRSSAPGSSDFHDVISASIRKVC
jgi:hypothetical protein